MIHSLSRLPKGKTEVVVRCDSCADPLQDIKFSVMGGNNRSGDMNTTTVNSMASVTSRIRAAGWRTQGKSHTCLACLTKPKEQPKEEPMAQVPEPARQPTREQKREIMAMLQDVYDSKAQRYRGIETDKSVAETLGDGILWGWVAQLREEFFGPEGNEEIDKLVAEVRDLVRRGDELHAKLHDDHAKVIAGMREMGEVKSRLTAIADKLSGQKPRVVAVK